jgi:hypothetical protein
MSMFFRITFENGDRDDCQTGTELYNRTAHGLVKRIQVMKVEGGGPRVCEPVAIATIDGFVACEEFIGLVSE